ncbi:hypothetical protein CC86DRAFT_370874 [Ophiobolus disseminans]|uniref:Uncharacterized protein n=1 Tax=Ophiobolus disseminans TaxID=1469910 RepID=A0A6A6ZVI5_9PLEO|nr:hypothetical protein CC86DRAFT_370874 [Ophiobolus disseminans]
MKLFSAPAAERREQKYSECISRFPLSPSRKDVVDARQDVLSLINRRSEISHWIKANLTKARGAQLDDDKHTPSRQNLALSRAYDDLDLELSHAIEVYAAYRCHDFSSSIAHGLPFEMRMTVFDFLTFEPDVVACGFSARLQQDPRIGGTNVSSFGGYTISAIFRSRHYFKLSFVAPIQAEIVQSYWRVNHFQVDCRKLKSWIEPVIHDHNAQLKMVPTDHIRRMIVGVRADAVNQHSTSGLRGATTTDGPRPLNAACRTLEALLTVKHPRAFELELALSANNLEQIERDLDALRNIRQRLIASGMKVRVTSMSCRGLRSRFPLCLDPFFEQPSDWNVIVAHHRRA